MLFTRDKKLTLSVSFGKNTLMEIYTYENNSFATGYILV